MKGCYMPIFSQIGQKFTILLNKLAIFWGPKIPYVLYREIVILEMLSNECGSYPNAAEKNF